MSDKAPERDDDAGFFGRWSRRKAQVRTGQAVPAEPPRPVVSAVSAPLAGDGAIAPAVSRPVVQPSPPEAHAPSDEQTARRADEAVAEPPPALSLDDVKALTPEADFSPFVAREVSPEVRNAAMRKLFADPKFNVMDGLDIYIDDYSKPDPLPPALARQLVSAQFMKLFDEPQEPKDPPQPAQTTEPLAASEPPATSEAKASEVEARDKAEPAPQAADDSPTPKTP